MVQVRLEGVTRRFPDVVAVDHVSLEITDSEFFTVLGPSGCGKSTLLRLIAGLEYPDIGRIYFDSQDVTDLPPYQRSTGMVFQNYALWPHMNVYENIEYGLRLRNMPKEQIEKKVRHIIEFVKLQGMERKFPTQLSGGQQQRVALARALVIEPKLLLLDEPLSNLDAKLRIEMREEIKRIQKSLGVTTIYVTHDQEEAMVISDRMAIMNRGRIVQVAPPIEAYKRPSNLFVATFLGRCNIINGTLEKIENGLAKVRIENDYIHGIISDFGSNVNAKPPVSCIIRPESFSPIAQGRGNVFEGIVEWISFAGPYTQLRVRTNYGNLLANIGAGYQSQVGSLVRLHVPYEEIIVIPSAEEEEIAYVKELVTK